MSLENKDSTRLLGNKGTPALTLGTRSWVQYMEANTEEWSFITVNLENCVKVGQDRKTQINEDAPLQGECSLSLETLEGTQYQHQLKKCQTHVN